MLQGLLWTYTIGQIRISVSSKVTVAIEFCFFEAEEDDDEAHHADDSAQISDPSPAKAVCYVCADKRPAVYRVSSDA